MKMSKKIFVLMLSMMLVIGCAVGSTVAWLTATTVEVTNTFTVGNIEIDLKEHDLKADGTLDKNTEVTKVDTYKVVPGATQPKDPFVRVKKGSEKCYVYAFVCNQLVIEGDCVAEVNIDTNKWEYIAAANPTSSTRTLYRYKSVVDASNEDVLCEVFSTVTYDGNKITKDNIADLNGKTIAIDAFAHQSENIESIDVADKEAKAHFGFSSNNS